MTVAATHLHPNVLVEAYRRGVFPMSERDGSIRWYTADPRGIIPLDTFHIPKTLKQIIRQKRFEVRINFDFCQTMRLCMLTRPEGSWISDELIDAYARLHEMGMAHSVECWRAEKMVGGLYGVSVGGAFFGESMFHHETDASKVALVHLVERLKEREFALLDTQATTPHLCRFGAIDIRARDYMHLLESAVELDRQFA